MFKGALDKSTTVSYTHLDSFEDPELRYRQRYVDLVVNDGIKETFLKRATVVKTLRDVLDEAGYTEVETPIMQLSLIHI